MSEEEITQEKPFDQESAPERTFTQAELEQQLGARLAREREKFADYEALKQKAEKLDEIEEEQKSELEKLTERLAQSEAERARYETVVLEETTRSAIIAEASRQGAIDPEDVYALLRTEKLVNDDGEVEGVAEAVKKLTDSKPHLFGSRTPQPADQGARTTAPGEEEDVVAQLGRQILKSAGR